MIRFHVVVDRSFYGALGDMTSSCKLFADAASRT